ncbi:D-amino acid dehydrogenase small subunit [Komagataeibacter europaeus]|uniref:D-amino acid dehydrogenase small subunit n=1 Tax=Komagataeibacter europaeus TaxID=33995 RepID=A0A0M0EGN2_KOMEU|nr:FAD-binding oxidoreductase [Komagataeibacter europaeus]KON64086.1 D-amino acid dehydrogenase small subunit [Komagataeibacter europaeus]
MMKASVIVLGAGMVGTSTAYHLRQQGLEVVLVDARQPGLETSYGNAGVIQREAVEPYPFPRSVGKLFKVGLGLDNTVHYTPSALPGLASRLLRYWWNSRPSAYGHIAGAYSALIRHALDEHLPMIERAGASDQIIKDTGMYIMYRSARELTAEAAIARQKAQQYGLKLDVLNGTELASAQPMLKCSMAGALHWRDPWSIHGPGRLVGRYAELFGHDGGHFAIGHAQTLRRDGAGWQIGTADGVVQAEHVVIALGPWAGEALQPFGYNVPLFAKRGYHREYGAVKNCPDAPLLDTHTGTMLAPMGDGVLRITTGADFSRFGAPPALRQLTRCCHHAGEMLDLGGSRPKAGPWLGNRPCMPDMLPVIGPAPRHRGMWFHFGHGHQGITLGPVTGRMLAERIAGKTPFIDMTPYLPERLNL